MCCGINFKCLHEFHIGIFLLPSHSFVAFQAIASGQAVSHAGIMLFNAVASLISPSILNALKHRKPHPMQVRA